MENFIISPTLPRGGGGGGGVDIDRCINLTQVVLVHTEGRNERHLLSHGPVPKLRSCSLWAQMEGRYRDKYNLLPETVAYIVKSALRTPKGNNVHSVETFFFFSLSSV